MFWKKLALGLTLMVISIANLEAQQKLKLSLEKAIDMGLGASKSIKIAESKYKQADAKAEEIGTNLLPSLKFQAAYTRLSPVEEFKVSFPIGNTMVDFGFPVILNNYTTRLGLQQPLLNLNLSHSQEATKLLAEAAKIDISKDENEAKFNIESAYWSLVKAIKMLKLTDENINQIKAHLTDLQNMQNQGMVLGSELLKVQVQLSEATLRQVDAKNYVLMAEMNLNSLLGIDLYTPIEPETNAKTSESKISPLNALITQAQEQRAEIAATEKRLEASEENYSAASSNRYPQIYLTGNVNYSNPNQRIFPSKDQFDATWDIGVSLSYDLWNWNQSQHQMTQAEAQIFQTKNMISQIKDMVALELAQNYISLEQAMQKIKVSEVAVKQTEEQLRVTTERFKAGVAISSDVLDAEIALLQSKINLVNSQIDAEIANAKIQKSIGKKQ